MDRRDQWAAVHGLQRVGQDRIHERTNKLGFVADKHTLMFILPKLCQESPRTKSGQHMKQASDYILLCFCFCFSLCDREDQGAIIKAKPMVFRACISNNNLTFT